MREFNGISPVPFLAVVVLFAMLNAGNNVGCNSSQDRATEVANRPAYIVR